MTLRRHLHWWSAGCVAVGFAIAWIMTNLPFTQLLAKFALYQVHKNFGLIVAGLTAVRLVLAWRAGRAPRGSPLVLYGMLLAVPALGYLTAATSPVPVPTLFLMVWSVPHAIGPDSGLFEIAKISHRWLAVALMALAACHAMGFISSRSNRSRRGP